MITIYPTESRYSASHGWLKSNFSFSFADYYDPENTSFGVMRVLNDDFIAPEKGFGAHPHSDMEIISLVLSGKMRHQDSLGNKVTTSFGEVQRMTAGSGVIHTEHNASDTEELNLLQMWFQPEQRGLEPSYEATTFPVEQLSDQWVPVASHEPSQHVAKIHQDMTIYLRQLGSQETVQFTQEENRRIFLFVIQGTLSINGEHTLNTRDSARITSTPKLELTATEESLCMLIDLP